MKFDYWHLHRCVCLQGSRDSDVLPFEAGNLVMGNVVSMREPVWRTAIATARALGVPDVFEAWKWDAPLAPAAASTCIAPLRAALAQLAGAALTAPPDLEDDLLPSPEAVRAALYALSELFELAKARGVAVETWVD